MKTEILQLAWQCHEKLYHTWQCFFFYTINRIFENKFVFIFLSESICIVFRYKTKSYDAMTSLSIVLFSCRTYSSNQLKRSTPSLLYTHGNNIACNLWHKTTSIRTCEKIGTTWQKYELVTNGYELVKVWAEMINI